MMSNEPEIHHIGHRLRPGLTCCGMPMPPEQFEVRPRTRVVICEECTRVFKLLRELSGPDEPEGDSRED